MSAEEQRCTDHVSGGPVGTLPGTTSGASVGAVCDAHPERPAYTRVQGETDSFGCEYHLMCRACYDEYRKAADEEFNKPQRCDWCNNTKPFVRPYRDVDEGQAGPVYMVCKSCRDCDLKRLEEEFEASRYGDW